MDQANFPVHWIPLPESQELRSLINQPISCEQVWTEGIHLPWEPFYLDFTKLKDTLLSSLWLENLQAEWDKVHHFYSIKQEEIQKDMTLACQQVENASYSSFETISLAIYHLHQFLKLNYRGFLHLFVLHDQHYEKSTYDGYPKAHYLHNYFWDEAIQTLHELAISTDKLFTDDHYSTLDAYLKNVIQAPSANQVSSKSCQTVVQKYWVHPVHLLDFILLLSKEASVVDDPTVSPLAKMQIKHPSDQQLSKEPIVSTIYLDTDLFEDYYNSLKVISIPQTNTSTALSRLRGFTQNLKEAPHLYALEKKTYCAENYSQQHCIDKRIHIETEHLDAWIQGHYSIQEQLKDSSFQFQEEGQVASSSSIDKMKHAYMNWEREIRQASKKPVLHVTQNRIVYASRGQSVFISIDTDITMVRMLQLEDSSQSEPPQSIRFPYCVVQVYGELKEDSRLFYTLMQSMENHLLHAIDHFSIYLHGVATLFADQVDQKPHWLHHSLDLREYTDIWVERRLSETPSISSTRPASSRSSSTLYHNRIYSSATASTVVTYFENESDAEDDCKTLQKKPMVSTFQLKQDMSFLRPPWYPKRSLKHSFDSVCNFNHPTSSRSDPTSCRDCMIYVAHEGQDELTNRDENNATFYGYQESTTTLSSVFYQIFWPSRLRSLEKEPLLGANRKRNYLSFYHSQDDVLQSSSIKTTSVLTTIILVLVAVCLPLSVYFIVTIN